MLRVDWNGLQQGDRVLVHHDVDGAGQLLAGVVTEVVEASGSNEIAVRVQSPRTEIIHPQRLRVHHDPVESETHCWRCASHAPPVAAPKKRNG
jgi:hypothetical protein